MGSAGPLKRSCEDVMCALQSSALPDQQGWPHMACTAFVACLIKTNLLAT